MERRDGRLRQSRSLADLTDSSNDSHSHQHFHHHQLSQSNSGLLDLPGSFDAGKRHSTPALPNLEGLLAKISHAEREKLKVLEANNREVCVADVTSGGGSQQNLDFVGAGGSYQQSSLMLHPVNNAGHQPRSSSPRVARANPVFSSDSDENRLGSNLIFQPDDRRFSIQSSTGSGLEFMAQRYMTTESLYGARSRSNSSVGLASSASSVRGSESSSKAEITSAFQRENGSGSGGGGGEQDRFRSEIYSSLAPGKLYVSPSLPELQNARLGLKAPGDRRSVSPEGRRDDLMLDATSSFPFLDSHTRHHNNFSADTSEQDFSNRSSPAPPPRHNRLAEKRYSVPDILDSGDHSDFGNRLKVADLQRRRQSMVDIMDPLAGYASDRLGFDNGDVNLRSSARKLSALPKMTPRNSATDDAYFSLRSQMSSPVPPPPPPPPPPLTTLPTGRNGQPSSLRRKTLKNLTMSNSVPTINIPSGDFSGMDVPIKSPDADYNNDLSPTDTEKENQKGAYRLASNPNVYQASSDYSAYSGKLGPASDETRSTNADSIVDDDELEEETDEWRPYDVFQVAERESDDDGAVFREILKVLRLILYVFIFVCVLGGTTASRLSLFLLASGINKDERQKGESVVLLLFCICSPIVVNWFMAFMKILFSGKDWPSLLTFFVLLIMELLHGFGICLLVFRVLPAIDFFRGITVTMAIFQVPALLKLVLMERKPKMEFIHCMKILAAVLAFLAQIAAVAFFLMTQFPADIDKTISATNEQSTMSSPVSKKNLSDLVWELPLALVLMSLGWWENYVSGEWSLCGKVKLSFQRARKVVQDVRETVFFLVAPLKIGVIVLLSKFLTGATFQLPKKAPEGSPDATEIHLHGYSLLYLQIFASILVTYLTSLACKLHMQKAAFALPLLLSPPASLAVVYLQCRYEFLPTYWHIGSWFCPSIEVADLIIPLSCVGALWISYCIIVSHIWFPKSERMAKVERLFTTPHFDSVFPDMNLTLRRRRNDRELRATHLERFTYVGDDNAPDEKQSSDSDVTPMVYVCATMWHETQREMTQLLKSLFRLDYVHCASRLAQDKFQIRDPDYFDLEIHILFDDAFELDDDADRYVPNIFVKQLIESMEDAARSVIKGPIIIPPPVKTPTPYGGRLVWTMPGQTKMYVHIKDKNLIRHRKRWSQCMYLYYLLGYRLLGGKDESLTETGPEKEEKTSILRQRGDKSRGKAKAKRRTTASMPLRSLLGHMPPEKYEMTVRMSENTFIMTLDGDVDFQPDSVKLLLDRMKKNKKVGAVCGRIHPIGSGPMVWYQQFEYAIGHWLQKASEHVFGCVLCCPGCFSLFRGSALMDDNVMKRYTTKPTEASHFIQFEQGEDRWLCTLLLQQGHRIDYSAGADALTFAPETFNEFFNQRRRWSPSTLANMMDLLSTWRETVRINDNISRLYILYQFLLMASSILAPSTVVLMITGSYSSVLGFNVWWSFLLSVAPVAFYLVVCLTQKNDMQIQIGAVLTAFYTIVMMIATVGTLISIATESFNSPNVVFLSGLGIIFVVAALLHPQEFFCLVYGALYFLVVPSTFILLTVFYLCNLNNVSWGTREVPKKMTAGEEEANKIAEEEKAKKKKNKSVFSVYGVISLIQELRDAIRGLWGLRSEFQNQAGTDPQHQKTDIEKGLNPVVKPEPPASKPPLAPHHPPTGIEPNPDQPYWMNLEYLGFGMVKRLPEDEIEFWKFLIKKYLYPLDEDKGQKAKIAQDLINIRNNVVFIYVMMNFLWCVIALQLQTNQDTLKKFYIIEKYEPLSLVFLSVFALVLVLQFVSMLVHRWGTFLHLMSSTRVDWCTKTHSEEEFARFVVNETQKLQNLEPMPDYEEEADEDGMSLSDFDSSLHHNPNFSNSGANGDGQAGKSHGDAGGIYETIGRHAPTYPTYRHHPQLYRATSTNGQFPMLKTIFEQNLGNLQQRLMHKGTVVAAERRKPVARWDSRRYPWDRRGEMRQRFFNQNFQLPLQGADRMYV